MDLQPKTICDYCGLPAGGSVAGDGPQYCCYGCRLAARITQSRGADGENKLTLTLLGVAVFLSMNVMVVNWMLYGRDVFDPSGMHESVIAATTISIFQYLSLLLSAPVIVILGWPIARDSVVALRGGRVNSDALIVMGVAAAFVLSYVNVLRSEGGTYFDTACMILVLFTAGRYLEAGAKLRAAASLSALDKLLPERAKVVRDGVVTVLPIESVRVGDIIELTPGAAAPVDGVIVANASAFDERLITGESQPRHKTVGDMVFAGTLNGGGCVRFRAEAVGDDTALARIKALLMESRRSEGQFQRLADRMASVLVPAVTVAAIVVTIWTTRKSGFDEGVMRGLSMLLIACPCALGLATPLAVWAALNRAAQKQSLIRNVEALERLAAVRTIFFDKTGTLTESDAQVREVLTADESAAAQGVILAKVGGLCSQTHHHYAAAIQRFCAERQAAINPVDGATTTGGLGVEGVDRSTREPVYLGSAAYMQNRGQEFGEAFRRIVDRHIESGDAVACVGWGGWVRGVFTFDEVVRPRARETLDLLRRDGFDVFVLTGDHRRRAELLSRRLGVAVEGPLLPDQKVDRIRAVPAKKRGVMMVGDGLNDAPALAVADVGVAMACGADVSRETADICLLSSDLSTLPWLVDLSRRTVRIIRGNLAWAFAYNAIGLGLAASGRLTPLFSALAMVASSTLVVANSMRLLREPADQEASDLPRGAEWEAAA